MPKTDSETAIVEQGEQMFVSAFCLLLPIGNWLLLTQYYAHGPLQYAASCASCSVQQFENGFAVDGIFGPEELFETSTGVAIARLRPLLYSASRYSPFSPSTGSSGATATRNPASASSLMHEPSSKTGILKIDELRVDSVTRSSRFWSTKVGNLTFSCPKTHLRGYYFFDMSDGCANTTRGGCGGRSRDPSVILA